MESSTMGRVLFVFLLLLYVLMLINESPKPWQKDLNFEMSNMATRLHVLEETVQIHISSSLSPSLPPSSSSPSSSPALSPPSSPILAPRTTKRTAICLVGNMGASNTSQSVLQHVVEVLDADLFLSTSKVDAQSPPHRGAYVDPDLDLVAFFDSHVPNWREVRELSPSCNDKDWVGFLGGLPMHDAAAPTKKDNTTMMTGSGAYQIHDTWQCEELISREEKERGLDYQRVVISRMDLMWLVDHPDVLNLKGLSGTTDPNTCSIPCGRNDFGGVCDHHAVCSRNAARSYLTGKIKTLKKDEPLIRSKLNVEYHLDKVLSHYTVQISRFEFGAFRSCNPNSINIDKCAYIKELNMYGKKSGDQINIALRQMKLQKKW